MISSTHRFIYLHVPKTGGNSIQTLLQPYSDDSFVVRGHQDGRDRFNIQGRATPNKHARLAEYAAVLGRSITDYKIAVSVRQPLARAISHYFSPHRWVTRKYGTEEWIRKEVYWSVDAFEACLQKITPMVEFIKVDNKLVQPDQIVRFENLPTDFKQCTAMFGLETADLPHVNKSVATEMAQQAMTDPKARQLVAELFSDDHRFFDYPLS